uniref:Uncharacterized protein n=1 Tax=Corethron hystrix TaxID=216773 RepID=A0A7S1FRH3_9STRA|mmetsp:Transcript_22816/g.52291  ORF Transcript_22816/g.52291 Transcript_22816/m.52291 type:complete len:544 (+) Transcript_22816:147-1778(+)
MDHHLSLSSDECVIAETTPLFRQKKKSNVPEATERTKIDSSAKSATKRHAVFQDSTTFLYKSISEKKIVSSQLQSEISIFKPIISSIFRLIIATFVILIFIGGLTCVPMSSAIVGTVDTFFTEPETCPKLPQSFPESFQSSGFDYTSKQESFINVCYLYGHARSLIGWNSTPQLSVVMCSAHIDQFEVYTEPQKIILMQQKTVPNMAQKDRNGAGLKMLKELLIRIFSSFFNVEESYARLEIQNYTWPIVTAQDFHMNFHSWIYPIVDVSVSNLRIDVIFDDLFMKKNNVERLLKILPPRPQVESYPKIGTVDIHNLTIAIYLKLQKKKVKETRRFLLAEFNIQKDILRIVHQATSEAGKSGTDQLSIDTMIDRVLELSANLTFSDAYILSISRQIQQLDQKLHDFDDIREAVMNGVEEWHEEVTSHWKKLWSRCQRRMAEDVEKKKLDLVSIYDHVAKWTSDTGENIEEIWNQASIFIGKMQYSWKSNLDKTGNEFQQNIEKVLRKARSSQQPKIVENIRTDLTRAFFKFKERKTIKQKSKS